MVAYFGESCYGSRPGALIGIVRLEKNSISRLLSVLRGSALAYLCGLHIATLSCCRRPHAAPRNLVKNSEGLAALRGGCGCAYHSVTGPQSYFVSTCRRLFFLNFFHFGAGHLREERVRSHDQQNPDPEDRTPG